MSPNENSPQDDSDTKIFPEWKMSGDNQNLTIGLAVLVLALGGLGLRSCFGGDGSVSETIATVVAPANNAATSSVAASVVDTAPPTTAVAPAAVATTVAPPTTATPATTPAVDLTPDVAAAVKSFPGVTGVANGSTAILTGFVDSDAQSTQAAEAALGVDGIDTVDNQLKTVDSGALAALSEAGVSDAAVTVSNLVVTASGTIASEAARQPALDAVAAVPGVKSVTDKLTVDTSLTDALNELVDLTPVQFETGSANLLPESNPTLDAAAKILIDAPGTDIIEVQGYTDIRGSAEANQQLSADRAAAVVTALVERGVPAERLTSKGYGGTTKFAEGDTDEAYAANRRVVFALAK